MEAVHAKRKQLAIVLNRYYARAGQGKCEVYDGQFGEWLAEITSLEEEIAQLRRILVN